MKIKKLANSNIEFLTDSDELIAVMQQIGAQLIVNAEGVKIIQTGYPEFYIKTEDVVSTQLMPAAAIAFTGDTTALVALLSASFFVLTSENIAYDPTGTGLTATTVQDAITELATVPLKYKAYITQSGTDAPVAQVIQNDLSAAVLWTYVGVGDYLASLAGAFPAANKIVVSFQPESVLVLTAAYWNNGNSFGISNADLTGTPANAVTGWISVEVYP